MIVSLDQLKAAKIKVKLVGCDGNAFAVLGTVTAAMKKANVCSPLQKEIQAKMVSNDYNHLLGVCMDLFVVS